MLRSIAAISLISFFMVGTATAAQAQTVSLSRAQFIATMDAEYRKIDVNHNQIVTRSELEMHQREVLAAAAARRARATFATIDTDHDGKISVDEFTKAVARPGAVDGNAIMGRLDANRDQKVSVVEYRILTLANFDRIDTDRDGTITAAEQAASGIAK